MLNYDIQLSELTKLHRQNTPKNVDSCLIVASMS